MQAVSWPCSVPSIIPVLREREEALLVIANLNSTSCCSRQFKVHRLRAAHRQRDRAYATSTGAMNNKNGWRCRDMSASLLPSSTMFRHAGARLACRTSLCIAAAGDGLEPSLVLVEAWEER